MSVPLTCSAPVTLASFVCDQHLAGIRDEMFMLAATTIIPLGRLMRICCCRGNCCQGSCVGEGGNSRCEVGIVAPVYDSGLCR